jgi:hypothetical protein
MWQARNFAGRCSTSGRSCSRCRNKVFLMPGGHV